MSLYLSPSKTIPTGVRTLSWVEVVDLLSKHTPVSDKFQASGFAPHTLLPTGRRRDSDVASVSLFVFDVDTGSPSDVSNCEALLRQANQAAHFYSSFSFTADHPKPPFRLVLPPSRPVTPEEFASLRTLLISRFQIPCAPEKCVAPSHFWFLPSCPPERSSEVVTETIHGQPLDVGALLCLAPPAPRLRPRAVGVKIVTPPPVDPSQPIDLRPLRDRVKKYAERLARKGEQRKATYLRNLLEGQALAEKGDRNNALLTTTGMAAWIAPDATLTEFTLLFQPSLDAMMAAGSKLDESQLERMLITAMEGRAHQLEEFESLQAEIRSVVRAFVKGK